jgi:hypothetical protein
MQKRREGKGRMERGATVLKRNRWLSLVVAGVLVVSLFSLHVAAKQEGRDETCADGESCSKEEGEESGKGVGEVGKEDEPFVCDFVQKMDFYERLGGMCVLRVMCPCV